MRYRGCYMQRHRAGGIEAGSACPIEFGAVQRFRRSTRVGEVEHDQIVGVRGTAHESEAVLDLNRQPGIRQRSTMDLCKVLARNVEHRKIDLDQGYRLYRLILEQLLGRTAVAAANDQRGLGRGMGDRRDVDQVLMIEKLVLFGRHQMSVETKQLAERFGVVDFDRLIWCLETLELARRANEKPGIVGQVFGQNARLKVAGRYIIRHRGPRGGSPEI